MAYLLLVAFLFLPSAFPQAKPLIDDPQVRVVLATNTPGQKSRPHKHDVNRLMIPLDDGKMRLAFEDGKIKDLAWKPGEFWWDQAGGIHTSENVGGTTYRIVEIELKNPAGSAARYPEKDPPKVDPEHFKVELDNGQVRVLRMKVAPGDKTALHEHLLPRVTLYLTDQYIRTTLANGRGSTFRNTAGQVSKGGRALHAERNLGPKPIEVLLIEIKPQ